MKPIIVRSLSKSHSLVEQLEARIAPATIIVQNLDDAGPGSLRQAVLDANDTPALDTIIFKTGLTGTVSLAGQITIDGPLSIKGPGGAKIVLSGINASRIFNVNDGDTAVDSPASFTGLVFTKGNAAVGGAINSTESLNVTSCIFASNVATGEGGAITMNGDTVGAKVKITSSQFSGNSAEDGGALYLEAGGGISIVKSIFTGNTATGQSGAVYLSHDSATNPAGKILIASSVFVGNSAASHGGALRIDGDNDQTPISIINTRITGNTSGGLGGGLYFERGDLTVSGTTFSNNTADAGGAIFFDQLDVGTITKTVFVNNRATDGAGPGGGAIGLRSDVKADSLTVTASTFVGNNSADRGGAISFQSGGILKTVASIFTGNRAGEAGGAISTNGTAANATTLTVTGGTFTDNRAESGGAIDSNGDGAISIASAKFRSNRATLDDGGALYLRSETTISVVGSLFSDNFAQDDGGGLIMGGNGTATLTGLTILNNTARDEGGGLAVFDGTTTLSKSTLRGNHGGVGGGISINGGDATIQTSIISGNTAKASHGGLYKGDPPAVTVAATTKIFGNLAPVTPNSN